MRRLPIFFLLDVSESMIGENLRSLECGMEEIVKALRQDAHALETVHMSVLAFAGKAGLLAPLVDLVTFYAPRLPVGSGTSLGAGLSCLMDEIDKNVIRRSATQRGDHKPVVYLMTDGRPTDRCEEAIKRWNEKYAKRATMVAIAIGSRADTSVLKQLTEHVILFDQRKPGDFDKMIQWITASISIQSESVEASTVVLAKTDDTMSFLNNALDKTVIDDQVVVIPGLCQLTKERYLLKYLPADAVLDDIRNNAGGQGLYIMSGCHPVDKSYEEWSDSTLAAPFINSSQLLGGAACPHCGNRYAFAMCACGGIHCVNGAGSASCPHCGNTGNYGVSSDDDAGEMIERGRG